VSVQKARTAAFLSRSDAAGILAATPDIAIYLANLRLFVRMRSPTVWRSPIAQWAIWRGRSFPMASTARSTVR